MSDPVRAQYEAYPYPARDPADEARRLVVGSPSHLLEVNHYLFGGARDFAQPFRVLVAGGGTGDGAIMLAQQLADAGPAGEVVYLDLSAASRAIAERRAQARGLGNISFHQGTLLELPSMGLGSFDYIDCCGVLHHLEDPLAGLQALTAMLDEDGGMGLMLYGALGRRGVYDLQAMLRQLCGDWPLAEQVDATRRLLAALPATNWFKRNPFLGDHKRSEAELVDLLLHSRDRAYTVDEIGHLVADAGLELVTFLEPARYDPATYLSDRALLAALGELPLLVRAAFAERLAGNMKAHVLYVTRSPKQTVAAIEGPETVPCLRMDGAKLAQAVARDLTLKAGFDGLSVTFPMPPLAPAILSAIDGRASLGAIHAGLQAQDPDLDWPRFEAEFRTLYDVLNGLNQMLLRHPAGGG